MQLKLCLSPLSILQRNRCDWRSNSFKITRRWLIITPHYIGMKCYSPQIGTPSTWRVSPADLLPQQSLDSATSAKCARAMPTKTNCHKSWLTKTNKITKLTHLKDLSNSSHVTRESWPSVTITIAQSKAIPSNSKTSLRLQQLSRFWTRLTQGSQRWTQP